MDAATLFTTARQALTELSPRLVDLVASMPDPGLAVPNSTWTTREIAVHLILGHQYYAEIATGAPSPIVYESKEQWAATIEAMHADVAETDPNKLAALLRDSIEKVGAELDVRAADQPITSLNGISLTLGHAVAEMLGEVLLHGYDLATALRVPWPIEPDHAAAVVIGYLPLNGLFLNPATAADHTARYRLELRGVAGVNVTFKDGRYSWGPVDDEPVDGVIDADPVAYLLTATGRLSQWPLIALGRYAAGGARPELALGFGDLFVFP